MKIQIEQDLSKHLLERLEQDKPSAEASDWAKSGCKHCHGKGELGLVRAKLKGNNIIESEQLCACAKRNFRLWREKKLEEYKAESNGNGKKKEPAKKPPSEDFILRVKGRLANIDDEIEELNSSILAKKIEIAEAPHADWVTRIKDEDHEVLSNLELMQDQISSLGFDAAKAELAAEKMMVRAREMVSGASKLREQVKKLEKTDLVDLGLQLEAIRAEGIVVGKRLDRVVHQLNHRVGVDKKRLEKLDARREKVIAESGLKDILSEAPETQEVLEHR